MKPKGVRAMTIIECVVHISSNRSEGQCLVIVTNEITKAFVSWLFRSKKLIKLRRNGIEIGRFDFALITAYANLGFLCEELERHSSDQRRAQQKVHSTFIALRS